MMLGRFDQNLRRSSTWKDRSWKIPYETGRVCRSD